MNPTDYSASSRAGQRSQTGEAPGGDAHGGEAAGAPGGAALRLDLGENKSPSMDAGEDGEAVANVMPIVSGGKLDPLHGLGARTKDLRRMEALINAMRLPVLVTLTLDRSRFGGPRHAYEFVMPFVSRLLSERLGVRIWCRVVEVQTDSGDGWIHWHCIIDAAGTAYDQTAIKGLPWVNLSALRADVMRHWCERWRFGGVGGQDIQLVKNKSGIVGYLANYVTKAWPAIPGWVLDRSMFRLVGFSVGANRLLRALGVLPPRVTPQRERSNRKRPVRRLLERLAMSGLRSKVVSATGRYLGKLPAPVSAIAELTCVVPQLCTITRTYERVTKAGREVVQRGYLGLRDASRELVDELWDLCLRTGAAQAARAAYAERRAYLRHGWAMMMGGRAMCA